MKNKYQLLDALNMIEKKYDTYFIDVSGVIYDGQKPFAHAIKAINKLLEKQKQIVFLSNNPRPRQFTDHIIKTCGVRGNYRIVTSGDLLHYTLTTTLSQKKIYHLGRNRQHVLLEGTNTQLTNSPFDADAIIVSCFVEGEEDHTIQ
jgi:ribonucleotide monophosphatase NagD (HAD superfamily)